MPLLLCLGFHERFWPTFKANALSKKNQTKATVQEYMRDLGKWRRAGT